MKKSILIACAAFIVTALFGCQSVPEHISEELDARQLIQLGQDNYDLHHYKAAQKYFNTVLERYGDDPKHYIEAKYELGHLFLKLKNYRSAWNNFTEIQKIYENVPMGLPGSYKILCGIELAKIPQDKIKEFESQPQIYESGDAQNNQEAERMRAGAERQMLEQEEEAARQAAAQEQSAPLLQRTPPAEPSIEAAPQQSPAPAQESQETPAKEESEAPAKSAEPQESAPADAQAKEAASEESAPEASSNE